jgi:predicted AAA+ superfamily ATPase
MVFMEDQIEQILKEKILSAAELAVPVLTRRDIGLPDIKGKAFAVIGMRRAGKTSFLHQCRGDLMARGAEPRNLVYFNFEDERLVDLRASDLHRVVDAHARVFPSSPSEKVTFFFDEIQLVPGWEQFCRRLLDSGNYGIFVSGSSAKLLSREIATSMRGRAWEILVQPFGFGEFLRHHGHAVPEDVGRLVARERAFLDHEFAAYLERGGFPEARGLPLADRRKLLQSYVDVVLLRDVIERHEVTNVTALRWMVRRLLGNPAGHFSITKFAADLKSQGVPVGREMLYQFLEQLEDTFLVASLPLATDSEKRRQVNPRKIYPVDMGLIPVFDRSLKANLGHALEVAVFQELQRRGYKTGYWKTASGFEVDFVVTTSAGGRELIQVCTSLDDPETREREVRALEEGRVECPEARAFVLTLESRLPYPEVPRGIRVMPAWEWILRGDSSSG